MPEQLTGPWSVFPEALSVVADQFEIAQEYAANAVKEGETLIERLVSFAGGLRPIDTGEPGIGEGNEFTPEPFDGTPPADPLINPKEYTPPPDPYPGEYTVDISGIRKPDADSITKPTLSINQGALGYSSALLEAIKAKLLHDLQNGASGVNPNVENEIWNRNRERDLLALYDAQNRIAADWAARGMPLPDGALTAALQELELNYTNKRLDTSRDIAIKQYEAAFQNTQFTTEKGIALEQILMNLWHLIQTRVFEASKATIEMEIQYFLGIIQKYKIMADIYNALVNAEIEKAKAKVTIYKEQVEAYKAKVQAEAARIDGLVKAYLGEVEIYKAKVEAYASLTNVEMKIYEVGLNRLIADANLKLKDAELRIQNQLSVDGLKIEAMKAQAQIYAQWIAGALSSIQANARLGADGTSSYQYRAPATIAEVEALLEFEGSHL